MNKNYFFDLHKHTDSRFWINNPTAEETVLALNNDAFACTTNPAYCSQLISLEQDYINGVINDQITKFSDYRDIAMAVYRVSVKRLMDMFMPLYEKSAGGAGFVTLQDDPCYDSDTERIISSVMENKKLSPNYMAKIPVIPGGIEAIEICVRHNIPICATEVFAVSQALYIAEKFEAAAKKYNIRPPFFITHISGIFDDYLKRIAYRLHIDISENDINLAGITVARKQYRELQTHGYDVLMLGGGARGIRHFTWLVGGPHITINWNTAREIMDADTKIKELVLEDTPDEIINRLNAIDDFRRAYDEKGLTCDEFADFGPVQNFRNQFLKGWYHLLMQIAAKKNELAL